MARGSGVAQQGAQSGLQFSQGQQNNASGLFNTLAPQLASEAAHPAGMTPTDMAAADSAEQQSTGGSQAGAVGAGALRAARTRNAGTADAAIADSTRSAGQQLSQGALQTQLRNSAMKEGQRRAAIAGEEGLYGASIGGATGGLNASANETNADVNAQNASWNWARFLLDPAMAAAGSAASGGAFGTLGGVKPS